MILAYQGLLLIFMVVCMFGIIGIEKDNHLRWQLTTIGAISIISYIMTLIML